MIELDVQRTGGSLGEVRVSYTVMYYTSTSSSPYTPVTVLQSGSLVFGKSVMKQVLVLEILNNAFLKSDSYFHVTLTGVTLTGKYCFCVSIHAPSFLGGQPCTSICERNYLHILSIVLIRKE